VDAKALKVTTVLHPAAVAALTVPNGQPRITLRIKIAGRTLSADVNAKSLRRCITAVDVAVVMQGRLEGDLIPEAAISAQPKTPKATVAA
jgi:hypothetical protein